MMRNLFLMLALACAVLFSSCSTAGLYKKPHAAQQTTFKAMPAGWKLAQPSDVVAQAAWWHAYDDEVLNHLLEKFSSQNQTLKALVAQFKQALAVVANGQSSYFPSVTGSLSVVREQQSQNATRNSLGTSPFNLYQGQFTASWEPDVWGSIGYAVDSAKASADIAQATLAASKLSMQATLVSTYFSLRALDLSQQALDRNVQILRKQLELQQKRHQAGVVAADALAQAQSQLETDLIQARDNQQQRAIFENALAILVGEPPESFKISPNGQWPKVPQIPVYLPSTLLERRPDIAQAERQVAQAFAQYGVAQAALFPAFNLSASLGSLSKGIAGWLQGPQAIWSIGPSMSAPLFDGGLRRAQKEAAHAGWEAAEAHYRQSVLAAFQDVENSLVNYETLQNDFTSQTVIYERTIQLETIATNKYHAGVNSLSDLLQAQSATAAQLSSLANRLSKWLSAHVALIKSFGGDWAMETQSSKPDDRQADRKTQTP